MRILHRDIKPANIFLTSSKHIVIGDYGLARAWLDPFYGTFPSTSLRARDSPGTLAYLAPEVVKGFYEGPDYPEVRKYADYSFEADIWSLGVTICESWSPSAGLFSLEEGESCMDSKRVIPRKILEIDIRPAVKRIVQGHPIWHLISMVSVQRSLLILSGQQ
jgi:serine/threonine protein kinase